MAWNWWKKLLGMDLENVVAELDQNDDGRIQIREVLSSKGLSIVIGVVISAIVSSLFSLVKEGLSSGEWNVDPTMSILQLLVPTLIVLYFFKLFTDAQDQEKKDLILANSLLYKEKEEDRKRYEEEINTLKNDKREMQMEKNLEIAQLRGGLETKDKEIEWIKEGYISCKESNPQPDRQ